MSKQLPQRIGTRNELAEVPSIHPAPVQVEVLAYQLWLDRGCPIGSPEEDWFRAEAELNQRDPKGRAA